MSFQTGFDNYGENDLRWRKSTERETSSDFRNGPRGNILLKPDKVKHFQEKERNILEQNLAKPSNQDISNSFGLSTALNQPLWSTTNSTNIQDQLSEDNTANYSSETLWKKHDDFSQYLLPPTPTSAFKKKGSSCSSTKKQKGKALR